MVYDYRNSGQMSVHLKGMVIYMDEALFQKARSETLQNRTCDGIGTLGEKTIHAVLKRYYEPYGDNHEVSLGGFVADAVGENGIFEIQTRQFEKLRPKLNAFLPLCRVTVVYPVVVRKRLNWIDPQTGEIVQQGKWFRCGSRYSFFSELYRIKPFLKNPNLFFRVVELTAEEYRLLNGYGAQKKNRAEKYDRIPESMQQEWVLNQPSDFAVFLPENLPDQFDSAVFALHAHIPRSVGQVALNILTELQVVERIGKRGNAHLYALPCISQQKTVK